MAGSLACPQFLSASDPKRRHISVLVPALAFFLLTTSLAVAQTVDLPPVSVEVTSPTTVATPLDQIANSVTVISGADMEREQRRTAPDALSTVPGLNVVQSGGPGALTSVFTRGTNSNHTKIFIDGIEVSDPSNPTRVFDLGQLLTSDIDRIEVLRGPQSGLYGADAIGGVISIVTKAGSGPPKATGMVEGGSFGTFNQTARLSGSQPQFNYAFNIAHFRTDSTPVTPLELLPPGRQRINDFYDNWTYSTKLGADVTDNFGVNLVARYTDATLRFTGTNDCGFFPSFVCFPDAAQSAQTVHQLFSRGEAVWSLFDDRFKNYFGVNYSDHWNWNKAPDPATPSVNRGDRTKYDWRGVLSAVAGQTLVMGLEQETERMHTDTVDAQNGNKAAYVELQSEFAKRVFFVGNIRYDDNDAFGGHSTYRLAPAVLVPVTETKLKASYGTGFKAPTLSDMFANFPPFFFGNPNLKPEESAGYDVGFEQPAANDRIRFGVTYFHNDITNLITTNDTFTTLINVGRAETWGEEAFASLVVTEQLKLRGDYTFTRAIDAMTGLDLLRRPRHKASLTAVWTPTEKLSLSSTLLVVGNWTDVNRSTFARVDAPGYTVVNVAANYTVNENATVFGRVDNLFNEHYQNPNGFLRPGIGVFGGLKLTH